MYYLVTISYDPPYCILPLSSNLTCTNWIILSFIVSQPRLAYSDILTGFWLVDDNSTIQFINLTILGFHDNSTSKNPYTQICFVDLKPWLVN